MTENVAAAGRDRLARARLYLIVDAAAGAVVAPALAGGVDIVQLRDKAVDDETLLRTASELRALCDAHDALLILNDRPDLVVEANADGVHLGQEDAPVEEARALLGGEPLIGVSTHSPEQIADATASSVDYLGVGPVHATPTKPGRAPVGHELVRHAANRLEKPFFAIGGIDPENVAAVVAAGARRVAVVRAIRDATDPRASAAALRNATLTEAHAGAPA